MTDVWFYDRVSGKKQLHQNQKPLSLIEQCILKHSDKNEIVLDPFMGSGTTGVACVNTNRRFIGMELDKQYFDIAKERINKTYEDIFSGVDNR
nr:site-specific DNA-methyltransferase [Anaerofustis stercorihominis]